MSKRSQLELALVRLAGDAAGVSARAALIMANGPDAAANSLRNPNGLDEAVAELLGLVKALQNRGLIADKPIARSRAYGKAVRMLDDAAGVAGEPLVRVISGGKE